MSMESGVVGQRIPELQRDLSLLSESTDRIKTKIGNLRTRFDLVLSDAPPANPTPDLAKQMSSCQMSRLLSEQMDHLYLIERIIDDMMERCEVPEPVSPPGIAAKR